MGWKTCGSCPSKGLFILQHTDKRDINSSYEITKSAIDKKGDGKLANRRAKIQAAVKEAREKRAADEKAKDTKDCTGTSTPHTKNNIFINIDGDS